MDNNPILSSLDLRNVNLVNINDHEFANTPQLNCISLNDTFIANTLLYNIDPNCIYSLNCTGLGCMDTNALNYDPNVIGDDGSCIYQALTYVPDDNFENYLESVGWGDGIALNDSVLTSSLVFVISLDVSGLSISDLTSWNAIDVNGDVNLHGDGLSELPLKFNVIYGNFYCSNNQLTTLEGCPKIIKEHFLLFKP